MSTLFTLLHLAALVAFIVFFVKSRKAKKAGEETGTFKKYMLISIAVWFVSLVLVGVTAPKTETVETAQEATEEATEQAKVETTVEETKEEAKEETTSSETTETDELEALKAELKEKYDVSEPSKFVKGDATGNWRIVKVANATPPSDYAVDYAKAYMQEGDVHYIVNFSLKTTTQFRILGGKLSAITTEYVDKEEHDASIIGQGMLYTERYFDMATGEEVTTDADESAGTVDEATLISAVEEAIEGQVGEGEKITVVTFDGSNLTVTVDMSGADTSIFSAKEIAESRISSITDAILELDDSYYNTWETITVDFGKEGKAVLDKSMVKDEGFGKYFDFPMGILG